MLTASLKDRNIYILFFRHQTKPPTFFLHGCRTTSMLQKTIDKNFDSQLIQSWIQIRRIETEITVVTLTF